MSKHSEHYITTCDSLLSKLSNDICLTFHVRIFTFCASILKLEKMKDILLNTTDNYYSKIGNNKIFIVLNI